MTASTRAEERPKKEHHAHDGPWAGEHQDMDRPGCTTACWLQGDHVVTVGFGEDGPEGLVEVGRKEVLERIYTLNWDRAEEVTT